MQLGCQKGSTHLNYCTIVNICLTDKGSQKWCSCCKCALLYSIFCFCYFAALDYAAYLLPGVDLVACVIKAWLLLTVVCVLVAGWRFSPRLTVRTWFTGPWKDRGQTSTINVAVQLYKTENIQLDRANAENMVRFLQTLVLKFCFFLWPVWLLKVKGVSAASLRSSECLSGWALIQGDGLRPTRVPVTIEKCLILTLCFIK